VDLALDTCTPRLSLTAGTASRRATFTAPEDRRSNKHLSIGLDEVCGRIRSSPAALRRLYFTVGPGSFTGTRISIAYSLGLAFGRPVKLHPVSTLFAMALDGTAGETVPLLPTGRNLWYAARYRRVGRPVEIEAPGILGTADLARLARGAEALVLPGLPLPPFEARALARPLSEVLFLHRTRCGRATTQVVPLYLRSFS
jgi:tRNA threonylcarbamoyl adenosine modification protein YeaZ